jgi:hypothetical protein
MSLTTMNARVPQKGSKSFLQETLRAAAVLMI